MRNRLPSASTLGASFVFLVIVILFFIFQSVQNEPYVENPQIAIDSGPWEIYFTKPAGLASTNNLEDPEAILVEAIDSARYSIDMAMYHLNLWSVRDALIRAHRRGVVVRLVTEEANVSIPEVQALVRAGIDVKPDKGLGIMHHKFVVIDSTEVWTGSLNLTWSGLYRNNNHIFRINSPEVAANYLQEFNEMMLEGRFGTASKRNTPNPILELDDGIVEVYFSPDNGVVSRILKLLAEADDTIDLMAFSFTSDPIGEAILERYREGVNVRVLVESAQAEATGSETPRLRAEGVDIFLDGNPDTMHHKVIIIDSEYVIFGSYNFTRSAEKVNDENVLIIHHQGLAAEFLGEFNRLLDQASNR
ncbi:MAG: DUF1669 domain-containing protein [Anaerolineales bacterium]|nr:DUF1669 domain-containing protein [Anaerolineales bacterium]